MFVEWPEAGRGVLPPARVEVDARARRRRHAAASRSPPPRRRCYKASPDARPRLRHRDRRRDERARPRRARCSASASGAARTLLEDVDELLAGATASRRPTSTRSSSAPGPEASRARASGSRSRAGSALALGDPRRGRLDARCARDGASGRVRRRSTRGAARCSSAGPRAVSPDDLELEPGTLCIGNGAVRYRATLERLGAEVPPDDDDRHVPHARLHAALAREYGSVEEIEPIYVRVPDAELPRA